MIKYEEFARMEIRIGTISEAERVPDTDRLLKLIVDLGSEKRQLVAGIGGKYHPEDVIGKQVPVLLNLEPATIKGVESNGMILAVSLDKPILLVPQEIVPMGSKIR